jgi:hypothetical protein
VDYYEEVILQRIEDKTNLETGEDVDVMVDEDTEDDTCWRFWQRQLDAFVAYLGHTWIGRKAARSGRRGRSFIAHDVWNQYETLAMSSEEDEAFCLTNNSLERYNRTLKKLVGSHPNVWLFIQSLIGQEADARRVPMHNATGMDISVNQGQDECHKDHTDKLIAVVKRCQDLSPYLYLQTLAKLLIDK